MNPTQSHRILAGEDARTEVEAGESSEIRDFHGWRRIWGRKEVWEGRKRARRAWEQRGEESGGEKWERDGSNGVCNPHFITVQPRPVGRSQIRSAGSRCPPIFSFKNEAARPVGRLPNRSAGYLTGRPVVNPVGRLSLGHFLWKFGISSLHSEFPHCTVSSYTVQATCQPYLQNNI